MSLTPEQLNQLDSTLVITVRGIALAEPEHLLAALKRVATFEGACAAAIFVQPREDSGWIEYITQTDFKGGGGITVGVLQRTPDGPVEYHS